MKTLFLLLAISGNFYNDVLALVSVTGTFLMLIGSIAGRSLRVLTSIGEWSLAAVFFGSLFQVSIIVTGLDPEKIGFVLPMQPALVNVLFAVSCLFLFGYWWLKRTQATGEP